MRGALSPDEVAEARRDISAAMADFNAARGRSFSKALTPEAAFRDPRIFRWMFQPRIVAVLKQILEPSYAMLPTLSVAHNQVGLVAGRYLGLKRPGWHIDSGAEGKQPYLADPAYRFVKCGIYLQDNTPEYGGGVDFVPGGHQFPIRTGNLEFDFKLKTLWNHFGIVFRAEIAPLEAGDFLAFDSRLPHRSTVPAAWHSRFTADDYQLGAVRDFPIEKTKYVIYWDSCRARCAESFLANCARRGESEIEAGGGLYFAYSAGLFYPDDYAAEFVARVTAAGIRVATLDPARAHRFRDRWTDRTRSVAV